MYCQNGGGSCEQSTSCMKDSFALTELTDRGFISYIPILAKLELKQNLDVLQ